MRVINMRDFGKEMDALTDEHMVALRAATVSGILRSLPELVERSPVDTGLYAQSWDFTETETSVILGNYAPYAPIIEYGARPFKPPITPLLAWAKRVLNDPSQPGAYSDRVWALALGTQRKIEREGMKPKKVMENAIPMILENIRAEYSKL